MPRSKAGLRCSGARALTEAAHDLGYLPLGPNGMGHLQFRHTGTGVCIVCPSKLSQGDRRWWNAVSELRRGTREGQERRRG